MGVYSVKWVTTSVPGRQLGPAGTTKWYTAGWALAPKKCGDKFPALSLWGAEGCFIINMCQVDCP